MEGFGSNGGWILEVSSRWCLSQGLLRVNISADLGGVGGSFLDEMIVTEELGYRCLFTLSLILSTNFLMEPASAILPATISTQTL